MIDEILEQLPEYIQDGNDYYYLQLLRSRRKNWTAQYWSYKKTSQNCQIYRNIGAMGETALLALQGLLDIVSRWDKEAK